VRIKKRSLKNEENGKKREICCKRGENTGKADY
jgi:hypothetical protein